MSKVYSHISSAIKVLETYNGAQPLAIHLKGFFSTQKKYGSRDRKSIAALCYAYFRTGHILRNAEKSEKILAGIFLSEHESNTFLQEMKPAWNDKINLPLTEKLSQAGIQEESLFPFFNDLSDDIEKKNFIQSFLKQPRLFLRARTGKHSVVLQKLDDAGIAFNTHSVDCISLHPGVKVDSILKINKEVVVQDFNSQKVLDYINMAEVLSKKIKPSAWDCCAASGGKSILLYDQLKGNVRLTVSDIRDSILINLKQRLDEAGISLNRSFVADLAKPYAGNKEKFDIIIADVPCSGSGTWSRSPEQLYYFHQKKIGEYASLQRSIILNTVPALAEEGLYFYITCSVFKEENENQVNFILENSNLKLVHLGYLKGYDNYADTMFVSVFKNQ